MKRGDRISLVIDRLAIGGRGIGRNSDGIVVFVELVAPLDEVLVEITRVKKSFAEARLIEILKPSPHRIAAQCPVYGSCGGCNWQHLEYREQLAQKRGMVETALQKFSGFAADSLIADVVASPKQFYYRNRIQLHRLQDRLGFLRRQSHEIVDIESCAIADPVLNDEISRLRRSARSSGSNSRPPRFELALGADGRLAQTPGFSQVNTEQNLNLIRHVVNLSRDAVKGHANPLIFDLYAGSGNFTFPIAEALPNSQIVAIELSRASVDFAKNRIAEHVKSAGAQINFDCLDVEQFLRSLNSRPQQITPTLIVLDPPRTGCSRGVVDRLVELKSQNIIYISCHPVTLARDLKPFADHGYRLRSVQPFDLFPQTDHVECVVHLERSRD